MIISGEFESEIMDAGRELGAAIRNSITVSNVLGTVTEVDEENFVFNIEVDDDTAFEGINATLYPGNICSIYLMPTVGSIVVVGFIENSMECPYLIKATQIDKIVIVNENTENSRIEITETAISVIRDKSSCVFTNEEVTLNAENININANEKIVFNGGDNSGLVLVNELTDALNGLVDDIKSMADTFDNHTHIGKDSMGGAITADPPTSPMTPPGSFSAGDYTNESIEQ